MVSVQINHGGGGGGRGIYVVVTVGDEVQLPPVLDHPVYNCTERHQQACMGYLYVGVFLEAVTVALNVALNATVALNVSVGQSENVIWYRNNK